MAKDPQYLNTRTWCLCDSLIVPLTQPIHSLSVKRKTPSSANIIEVIEYVTALDLTESYCFWQYPRIHKELEDFLGRATHQNTLYQAAGIKTVHTVAHGNHVVSDCGVGRIIKENMLIAKHRSCELHIIL